MHFLNLLFGATDPKVKYLQILLYEKKRNYNLIILKILFKILLFPSGNNVCFVFKKFFISQEDKTNFLGPTALYMSYIVL